MESIRRGCADCADKKKQHSLYEKLQELHKTIVSELSFFVQCAMHGVTEIYLRQQRCYTRVKIGSCWPDTALQRAAAWPHRIYASDCDTQTMEKQGL
jgi:hypothetical protein